MTTNNPAVPLVPIRPAFSRLSSNFVNLPAPPVTAAPVGDDGIVEPQDGLLELIDGSAFQGISFGAEGKSVTGECVFQTGKLRASYDDAAHTLLEFQAWWGTLNL
jgi:carbamoyl-phosphate synthase/aspartate carbamoyltransferase